MVVSDCIFTSSGKYIHHWTKKHEWNTKNSQRRLLVFLTIVTLSDRFYQFEIMMMSPNWWEHAQLRNYVTCKCIWYSHLECATGGREGGRYENKIEYKRFYFHPLTHQPAFHRPLDKLFFILIYIGCWAVGNNVTLGQSVIWLPKESTLPFVY